MGSARMLSAEQLADLAGRFAGARWSWADVDAEGLAARLGWLLARVEPSGYALLDTGYGVAGGQAVLSPSDGAFQSVHVTATEASGGDSPDRVAFRRDGFAAAVRGLRAVLGEPSDQRPGDEPECRWSVPVGVVRAVQGPSSVEISLVSPARIERIDILRDELSGGDGRGGQGGLGSEDDPDDEDERVDGFSW